MKKNFKTVLCITALLSVMSVLPAYSEDITIDIPGAYDDNTPLVVDGDLKIESGIIIQNNSQNDKATIDVNGKLINLGKIQGDDGILHVQNGGNNSGYISQNIIKFTQGSFENNGTILVDYLDSGADITGTGKLGIRAGVFAGNVTQENLTFTGTGERRIQIDKNLEIDTISGNGTFLLVSDNACVKANKNGSDTTKINFISYGKSTSLDAGNITIGDFDIRGGSLKFISGNVETSSKVHIWKNATLEVSKGDNGKASLVMGTNDFWEGTLKLTGGNLDITEYGINKALIAESGSLVAKDLEIGTGSEILKDTDVTAETISVITGGSVAIDDKDSISSSVSLDGGKLDYYVTTNPSYKLNATSGDLNLENGSKLVVDGNDHTIADAVNINIKSGAELTVDGGNLVLSDGDTWTGDVNLSSGSLTTNVTSNGKLNATGGNLDITGGNLTIVNGSSIADAVNLDIKSGAELTVDGGNLVLSDGDTWTGDVNLSSGSLTTNVTSNGKLNATGGNLDITGGNLTIVNGSSIADAVNLDIKSGAELTVDGGNLVLSDGDTWTGDVNLSSGNLTTNVTSNGKLNATGGNLNIDSGTLTVANGSSISEAVNTTINKNATLNITSGDVTFDKNDSSQGTISLNGGSLTLDNDLEYGKLEANSGKLNIVSTTLNNGSYVKNDVELNAKDGKIEVLNGELNINNGDNIEGAKISTGSGNSTFNYGSEKDQEFQLSASDGNINILENSNLTLTSNSSVSGKFNLQKDATITLNGANLTIGNTSSWDGAIKNDGGLININNFTKTSSTASFEQTSGSTDIINSNITFNKNSAIKGGDVNIYDSTLNLVNATVSNGNFNLEDNSILNLANTNVSGGNLTITSSSLNVTDNSSIAEAVNIKINNDAKANITGGNVVLNNGDTWDGTISLNGGSLTVKDLQQNGKLLANSGNLDISKITLDNGSYIKDAVKLSAENGVIDVKNGKLNINNNDNIDGAKISLTNEQSEFNYGSTQNKSFILSATNGNINLLENSNMTLAQTSIVMAKKLNIEKDATLTMDSSTAIFLDKNTTWNGNIINKGGNIFADNLDNSASTTASFSQEAGLTNIYNHSNVTLNKNSKISGGTIYIFDNSILNTINTEITKGEMVIDGTSAFAVKNGTFNLDKIIANGDGALINVLNGEIKTHSIGELNVATGNQANFNIDIHARSNQNNSNDQFKIGTLSGDGNINISNWSLGGDIYGWDAPIDRHIKLGNVFMNDNGEALLNESISVTDKTTFTPIGYYQLNKSIASSGYTLDLVKYNPQVFRGQVATVAQWMNQLAIDDMLFTHSMVLPSFKDENGKMANNYAAINPQFAPYQYSIKDGGLWYKAYGTFEHLHMNQGLKVGNNSYGSLIGADFGLKELKNGWKFMPTAYIGYNGAHQYGKGMSQYQNGGQLGFMGTWYKDNVILSGLAYGGVYDNQMDIGGNSENTFNYFAGTAAKAAYNWKFHKDWVLQPNLMVAYNFFGQQNWHSDFGQMGMMAGMLHGVNIAPGLNLIWEKDTFSAYLTVQYMYNVNGASGGRAGNVNLPHVEMKRGYIQYGVGCTKKFTDRASGYLQAVLRNVGRTGVGFQAGFNFKLGK